MLVATVKTIELCVILIYGSYGTTTRPLIVQKCSKHATHFCINVGVFAANGIVTRPQIWGPSLSNMFKDRAQPYLLVESHRTAAHLLLNVPMWWLFACLPCKNKFIAETRFWKVEFISKFQGWQSQCTSILLQHWIFHDHVLFLSTTWLPAQGYIHFGRCSCFGSVIILRIHILSACEGRIV